MEAMAINRYIGTSPRKMRLVIDLIRGKGVDEALSILHFVPKHAAKAAEKVLRSAIANFQNKDQGGRSDTATLFVKTAFVDGGATAKRVLPAPMGRAYRVRKRSNHITIVVAQRPVAVKVKAAKKPAAKAAAPAPAATEAAAR
jgi:large subunit ribosomal protein L22